MNQVKAANIIPNFILKKKGIEEYYQVKEVGESKSSESANYYVFFGFHISQNLMHKFFESEGKNINVYKKEELHSSIRVIK